MEPQDRNTVRWLRSRAYQKARAAVERMLRRPRRILTLVERASQKTQTNANGPIRKTIESVKVLTRLVTAYAKGQYRAISFENISLIIAAIIYFVMPFDALPDFVAMLGLMDDAAVLAWTWTAVKEEVEAFLRWELEQESAHKVEQKTLSEESADDPPLSTCRSKLRDHREAFGPSPHRRPLSTRHAFSAVLPCA